MNGIFNEHKKLCGTPANSGIVQGRVRLAQMSEKIDDIKEGDILVVPQLKTRHLYSIPYVKAIITDEGCMSCFASIVSRELGVPCITNTKTATKTLREGDYIEVDGNVGVVKVIG